MSTMADSLPLSVAATDSNHQPPSCSLAPTPRRDGATQAPSGMPPSVTAGVAVAGVASASSTTTALVVSSSPPQGSWPLGKRTKQEIANDLGVFLKWYLNFGVYRLNKGKFKAGILQLDYLHGRVGVGRKGQIYLHIPFEVLEKATLSETNPRCFHIHLHDLTPVVLYSQQEGDRSKIVDELRQIINNTEFLRGSTEPPKLNDYAEIIRFGEVEKKGPVKRVTRTLMLTDTQLMCLRDTTRDAFPVNVIELCDVIGVEREKEATFKVITEHRTYHFKAPSTPKREKWVTKLTAAIELQSEMELALEEKKKKRRQKAASVGLMSGLSLPSGIPLLGRYEVKFTELHTLFGQSIQKPESNKIINLKTYYDIRYALLQNQVRKQMLIVSDATGALSENTTGTHPILKQDEGNEEQQEENGMGEILTRKQRKLIKRRAKLTSSSPDVSSSLVGNAEAKRRFLRKKGKQGRQINSHSDVIVR